MNETLKMKITALTKTESGTYNESGDILQDLLNGGEAPETLEDALYWLSEEGYEPVSGFEGWGTVVKHEETGDLLSITVPAQFTIEGGQRYKDSQDWDGDTFGNHDPEIYNSLNEAETALESAIDWVTKNAPAFDFVRIIKSEFEACGVNSQVVQFEGLN